MSVPEDLLPAEKKIREQLGHLPLDFRAMEAVSSVAEVASRLAPSEQESLAAMLRTLLRAVDAGADRPVE